MSAGNFVISLDCEGKWGMADQTSEALSWITSERLAEAYGWLLAEFEENGLRATFAFVGALCLPDSTHVEASDAFAAHPSWFSSYRHDLAAGNLEGWHEPDLVQRVEAAGHEIGCHGFTHVPMDLDGATPELLRDELLRWSTHLNREPRTFVYPRNRVEFTDELSGGGVLAYRRSPYAGGSYSTLRSSLPILRDVNIWQRPETVVAPDAGVWELPQTDFLNHRRSLRGRVPLDLVARRWESAIRHAVSDQHVVHAWFHPHNLIDSDEMRSLIQRLVRFAGAAVERGELRSSTQLDLFELTSAA